MAIVNTKTFGKHLDGDVNEIFFDEFMNVRTEFSDIAHVSTAPKGDHYTEAELSGLGGMRFLAEGDAVQFDLPVEGHEKTIRYKDFGLGFQITKNMYKDDLFRNFEKMPQQLAKSAARKRETEFWDLFNSGFSAQTARDGQFVFDTDHDLLKAGADQANEPSTGGSLSETTLQAAFEYYDNLVDEAGNPIDMTPFKLIIPTELRWTADQLAKSTGKIGSANNDLNTMNAGNGFVDGYQIHMSRWLTSETAWFLMAKEHDFRFYWKEQATMESADDFYTGNALWKVTMRFFPFVMGWRGCWGNPGV